MREEKFNERCSRLYTGPVGSHLSSSPSFDGPVIKFFASASQLLH